MDYLAKKSEIKGLITQSNADEVLKNVSEAGRTKLVKWIISKLSVHNIDDCFVCAAKAGKLKVVQFLHANGADIRAGNDYAIRWASHNGHLDVVHFLHANGADISAVEKYHKNVESYITAKKWLQTDVSKLKRNAAKVFVANYEALPEADIIPEEVMQILTAVKI